MRTLWSGGTYSVCKLLQPPQLGINVITPTYAKHPQSGLPMFLLYTSLLKGILHVKETTWSMLEPGQNLTNSQGNDSK